MGYSAVILHHRHLKFYAVTSGGKEQVWAGWNLQEETQTVLINFKWLNSHLTVRSTSDKSSSFFQYLVSKNNELNTFF